MVSAIGGGLLVLVALGFVGLVVRVGHRRRADGPTSIPGSGHTLEWAAADAAAPILSEAPVYDARHAGEADS